MSFLASNLLESRFTRSGMQETEHLVMNLSYREAQPKQIGTVTYSDPFGFSRGLISKKPRSRSYQIMHSIRLKTSKSKREIRFTNQITLFSLNRVESPIRTNNNQVTQYWLTSNHTPQ
jgi:hypothetical protein